MWHLGWDQSEMKKPDMGNTWGERICIQEEGTEMHWCPLLPILGIKRLNSSIEIVRCKFQRKNAKACLVWFHLTLSASASAFCLPWWWWGCYKAAFESIRLIKLETVSLKELNRHVFLGNIFLRWKTFMGTYILLPQKMDWKI